MALLPADRFVAVEPLFGDKPAILETKPLTATEGTLLVNATAVADSGLQIEALDAEGNVLPGFAANECRLEKHDDLRYRVTWKGGKTLAALTKISPRFRLRFLVHGDARLFAFQVVAETNKSTAESR